MAPGQTGPEAFLHLFHTCKISAHRSPTVVEDSKCYSSVSTAQILFSVSKANGTGVISTAAFNGITLASG